MYLLFLQTAHTSRGSFILYVFCCCEELTNVVCYLDTSSESLSNPAVPDQASLTRSVLQSVRFEGARSPNKNPSQLWFDNLQYLMFSERLSPKTDYIKAVLWHLVTSDGLLNTYRVKVHTRVVAKGLPQSFITWQRVIARWNNNSGGSVWSKLTAQFTVTQCQHT